MKRTLLAFCILGIGLSANFASAMDLPVSYWVDAKALKSGAPAGTLLTFTLYSDSACTALYSTTVIDIDLVSFEVERLKLAAVKGSAKPPKPVRINAVLSGVPASTAAYLKIVGAGVTPVNGACQVQAAGVAGPTGPTGPTGLLSIQTFGGFVFPILGSSANYVFAGVTTTVTVTSTTQRLTASGQAPLRKTTAGTQSIQYGICYQLNGAGAILDFEGPNFSIGEVDDGPRHSFAISASTVPGVIGTHTVGFCVRNNGGAATLDDNDFSNGWVMLTD